MLCGVRTHSWWDSVHDSSDQGRQGSVTTPSSAHHSPPCLGRLQAFSYLFLLWLLKCPQTFPTAAWGCP